MTHRWHATDQSPIAGREVGFSKKGDCHKENLSCLASRHPEPMTMQAVMDFLSAYILNAALQTPHASSG